MPTKKTNVPRWAFFKCSSMMCKATSVFPVPVSAQIIVFSPVFAYSASSYW